ncbi:hypothetical protein DP117_29890 [Brasilonema sp. UFV-L1]|nr:hypothetical protein [Brasilonema sp. UFV-L1]
MVWMVVEQPMLAYHIQKLWLFPLYEPFFFCFLWFFTQQMRFLRLCHSLKTANTTLMIRFTRITPSINSHTLDEVKAIQSMSKQQENFTGITVLTKVRKTTLHGLAIQHQYIYQHTLGF